MSTRAQIGFYERESGLESRPIALIYQHSDGYPSSREAGVVRTLIDIFPPLIEQRGSYDPSYLAAQTLYRLIDRYDKGESGLGFGLDNELHGDTRFYYAVVSQGVYVFDARDLIDRQLDDLSEVKPMFFTSWRHDEERRNIEQQIEELQARLNNLNLAKQSIACRQP